MPDYIPPLQLPTGLAENLIKLTAARGAPWAQMAQGLGQDFGSAFEKIGQARGQSMTPENLQALSNFIRGQGGGMPGMPGQPQSTGIPGFKGRVPNTVVNDILSTQRTLAAQTLKNQGSHVEITPEMIEANPDLKKRGIVPGLYPASFATSLMKTGSGSDQNLSSEEQNALVKATLRQDNPLAPSMISFRGPRAKTMAQALIKDPSWSPNKSEAGLAGAKTGASTTASKAADIRVNLDSAHGGFTEVMNMAKPIAARMGKDQIGLLNKAIQAGKTEFNDQDSILMNTYLDLASSNYARISKGGSASIGEEDKADAKKLLSSKLNEGGLESVQQAMETEYQGRIGGLPGDKAKSKGGAEKVSGWSGGKTHTYPDGTKIEWNGKEWVKVR